MCCAKKLIPWNTSMHMMYACGSIIKSNGVLSSYSTSAPLGFRNIDKIKSFFLGISFLHVLAPSHVFHLILLCQFNFITAPALTRYFRIIFLCSSGSLANIYSSSSLNKKKIKSKIQAKFLCFIHIKSHVLLKSDIITEMYKKNRQHS